MRTKKRQKDLEPTPTAKHTKRGRRGSAQARHFKEWHPPQNWSAYDHQPLLFTRGPFNPRDYAFADPEVQEDADEILFLLVFWRAPTPEVEYELLRELEFLLDYCYYGY